MPKVRYENGDKRIHKQKGEVNKPKESLKYHWVRSHDTKLLTFPSREINQGFYRELVAIVPPEIL